MQLICSIQNGQPISKMTYLVHLSCSLSTPKRVQDMVLQGDDQPASLYVCRDKHNDDHENDHACFAPIPTLHIDQVSVDPDQLQQLKSALSSWGCFQAVGHGISSLLLDNIRKVGREFFLLPMEEKIKYAKKVDDFEGYGGDPPPEEGQPLDWQDRLFLDVYPLHRRKLHLWPENPPSFREVLAEYTEKLRVMTGVVSRAIAKCLDLEEDCLVNMFGENAPLQVRFNYYSPSPRPDLVMGLKPHADNSGYTLILQDEVHGLQISKHGKWLTVPTNPDAILVLIGDQMEIMTNGTFKSPVHRVVSNAGQARTSIAVFYTPEEEKEVGPVEALIDEKMNKPRKYKHVRNYADKFVEFYNKGQRAIHIAQI